MMPIVYGTTWIQVFIACLILLLYTESSVKTVPPLTEDYKRGNKPLTSQFQYRGIGGNQPMWRKNIWYSSNGYRWQCHRFPWKTTSNRLFHKSAIEIDVFLTIDVETIGDSRPCFDYPMHWFYMGKNRMETEHMWIITRRKIIQSLWLLTLTPHPHPQLAEFSAPFVHDRRVLMWDKRRDISNPTLTPQWFNSFTWISCNNSFTWISCNLEKWSLRWSTQLR